MRPTYKRLIITAIALIIGLCQLTPWHDQPYDRYLRKQVRQHKDTFETLLQEARTLVNTQQVPHLMPALMRVCHDKNVDLSTYFTQFNCSDIKTVDKRNHVLLQHLLTRSQSVFRQGLDLKGGTAFSLRIQPQALEGKSDWECQGLLQKAMEVINSRIDALGIAEPIVRTHGRDTIEVQLAGVSLETNPDLVGALKKPAKLEFCIVKTDLPEGEPIPIGYTKRFLTYDNENGEPTQVPLIVKKIPEMTGKSVQEAVPMVDPNGHYQVSLTFTPAGKERFAAITRQQLHKPLAIVLDGKVCSAPVIQSEITNGQASISGHFTQREAIELANVLNNPLEFELDLAEIYTVGPSLASSAKQTAIASSIAGILLVLTTLIAYYRLPGSICGLTLCLNFIFILAAWAALEATITLPSITALALTLGMAVDANVLIFERIREELKNGASSEEALASGHKKALLTILDSNLTTLLTAGLLILLGVGPVKGFGITLAIGVLTTLFTVLYFNRALLELLVTKQRFHFSTATRLANAQFNYLSRQKIAFTISAILLLIGAVAFGMRGKAIFSIDFVGGDELIVNSDAKIDSQSIRSLAREKHLGEVNATYQHAIGSATQHLKIQTEKDRGSAVLAALKAAYPNAHWKCISQNQIGASVSSDLQKNTLLSITCALIGILIYIALRFQFSYGVSSVLALLHDTCVTIGLYVAFGHQFTAPMVAAILLVIGYSINDKIIVFDRIREELKRDAFSPLHTLINRSINKTLSRTLMTSVTTLLPTLLLYACCSGVVRDYTLVFMIGICTGTFSSIFIATPIFYAWNHGDRKQLDKPIEETPQYEWMQS